MIDYKKKRRIASEEVANDQIDFQSEGQSEKSERKFIITHWLIAVATVIILAGVYITLGQYSGMSLPGVSKSNIYGSGWQAVFLSNGQVYFGKIVSADDKRLILTNIYYLQVVDKPLQRTQEGADTAAAQAQQSLTLVKLGNELHGPVDQMIINVSQVMLTEKLKEDSQVVKTIADYVKQQADTAKAAAKK
ncbi:MAG: hypothetical protein WCL13_04090 [bacterium]